jgi:RND family efflux transporter MFP subunit
MKNLKIIAVVVVVVGVVVAVLWNNKQKATAKSKGEISKAIPVSVASVAKQVLTENLSQVGTITAYSDVAIVSETQGKVTAIYSKVGDTKPAGGLLIQVDDELKQANYITAEANFEKAKKDLVRYEQLYKDGAITEAQIEQYRLNAKTAESQFITTRRAYTDTKIKTPISGVITARNVDLGTMVQNGTVVANVVDISKLKVKLNLSEADAFKFKVGEKVNVTTDVYPNVKFSGTIETVSAKADEAHTYPVEIVVPNTKEHPLKAGMFGRVEFNAASNDNALVIPREALVGSIKNPQVFVIENGIAKLRNIIVGREAELNLEVRSGLKEGDVVVASGQNNLVDFSEVAIIK